MDNVILDQYTSNETNNISSFEPYFENITFEDYILLNGVGEKQIINRFFEEWFLFFLKYYRIHKEKSIVLFIPCAAIKPYYNSPIHKIINESIGDSKKIQKIVISNAGVIPYEYCNKFPFDSYDWNPLCEYKEIMDLYTKITSDRLQKFIRNCILYEDNKWNIISYLRNDSESLKSLEIACAELNVNFTELQIAGDLEESKDTDLKLILPQNISKLIEKIKDLGGFD